MLPSSADSLVTSSNSNNNVVNNICNSDIITEKEKALFNDENDGVIVTKRDPESANPVRVGNIYNSELLVYYTLLALLL